MDEHPMQDLLTKGSNVLPDAWLMMGPQSLQYFSSSSLVLPYQGGGDTYGGPLIDSKTDCLYHQATSHRAQRLHQARAGLS